MSDNFLFIGKWYDSLATIKDKELRDSLIWSLLTYGATGEFISVDNDIANMTLTDWCAYLDEVKENYKGRVNGGKTGGRKPSFDREQLKKLIAAGKSGKEIAAELGVNTAAIYHDSVWINRVVNNFYK